MLPGRGYQEEKKEKRGLVLCLKNLMFFKWVCPTTLFPSAQNLGNKMDLVKAKLTRILMPFWVPQFRPNISLSASIPGPTMALLNEKEKKSIGPRMNNFNCAWFIRQFCLNCYGNQ